MFVRFFIDRPIFASVISIFIVLIGGLAYFQLPLAQYPEIAPPTISVWAQYPGADAQTVAETVAVPLEEQINGVENMLYMESNSTNDGQVRITVSFEVGTDLDTAQVLVQNRVSQATPKLPDVVKMYGVTTRKRSPTLIMMINFISPDQRYNELYLSNFIRLQVRDIILRVPGVGDATIFGEKEYSMRVWLDPDKMMSRDLTATDVTDAIEAQNIQIAAGQLGQPPLDDHSSMFQYIMRTQGRLESPEEFGEIVIKADADGRITQLKDVARMEISGKSMDTLSLLDNTPQVTLGIYQLPGANAISTAEGVYAAMAGLKKGFPEGVDYVIIHDTTPFIKESLHEVQVTLRDAVILVALVVLLFLQSWRAALIPLIAVPVSLIGTFAVMSGLGFSLNNLSLFGIVLAIGIVVDDAIVVVECVEHHMEQGMAPKAAARKAMSEVAGALVAIALVLSAVFIPVAFLSGITGQFFRQFALTIAVSTIISAFNSLTLSPALAAILLKPKGTARDPLTWLLDMTLGWFFKLFNMTFKAATTGYVFAVRQLLRLSFIVLVVYVGLLYLTYHTFTTVPTGFIPAMDRGYLMTTIQLPDSASLERTQEVSAEVSQLALETDGVVHAVATTGMSFATSSTASNLATIIIRLDDFKTRQEKNLPDTKILAELREKYNKLRGARITTMRAPPVDGMGSSLGFKIQVQDRGNLGLHSLQTVVDDIVDQAQKTQGLENVVTQFRSSTPQKYVRIDRKKAIAMGVPINGVFQALEVNLGSRYVNDFTYLGRNNQVKVQADARFRINPEDVRRIHVRNNDGKMVPLGSVLAIEDYFGPLVVSRFNMFPAAAITGNAAQGYSSGEGMDLIKGVAETQLPQGMTFEWSELSLQEQKAGNTAMLIFALAVLFVFLLLAAQYESWALPLAVILVVPMCLLCSLAGVIIAKLDMNIFTQIGFLVLVGLACKNAILIIEFAKARQDAGLSRIDATLDACRLRLRPIIMTSMAFILGVVPLVLSSGAGWEMRHTLGVTVFSGMIGVTLFGIFLTPVFYSVIQMIVGNKVRGEEE